MRTEKFQRHKQADNFVNRKVEGPPGTQLDEFNQILERRQNNSQDMKSTPVLSQK